MHMHLCSIKVYTSRVNLCLLICSLDIIFLVAVDWLLAYILRIHFAYINISSVVLRTVDLHCLSDLWENNNYCIIVYILQFVAFFYILQTRDFYYICFWHVGADMLLCSCGWFWRVFSVFVLAFLCEADALDDPCIPLYRSVIYVPPLHCAVLLASLLRTVATRRLCHKSSCLALL